MKLLGRAGKSVSRATGLHDFRRYQALKGLQGPLTKDQSAKLEKLMKLRLARAKRRGLLTAGAGGTGLALGSMGD